MEHAINSIKDKEKVKTLIDLVTRRIINFDMEFEDLSILLKSKTDFTLIYRGQDTWSCHYARCAEISFMQVNASLDAYLASLEREELAKVSEKPTQERARSTSI